MEPITKSSLSWIEIYNSDIFDLITIIIGVFLVISYLVYKKKAESSNNHVSYKITVLSRSAITIGWWLTGLTY